MYYSISTELIKRKKEEYIRMLKKELKRKKAKKMVHLEIADCEDAVLTPLGEKTIRGYIANMKAMKKQLLGAGEDTVIDTQIPSFKDILSDIEIFWGQDGDPEYLNGWQVTDNHDAPPLNIRLGYEIVDKSAYDSIAEKAKENADF